jgi:hypothetical protein
MRPIVFVGIFFMFTTVIFSGLALDQYSKRRTAEAQVITLRAQNKTLKKALVKSAAVAQWYLDKSIKEGGKRGKSKKQPKKDDLLPAKNN